MFSMNEASRKLKFAKMLVSLSNFILYVRHTNDAIVIESFRTFDAKWFMMAASFAINN